MRGTLVICPDLESLSREAAQRFVAAVAETLQGRGESFSVALSGGATPRRFYELLASDEFRPKIPWTHLHIFWGDERMVSPDHAESNYRVAREALLTHIPLPPQNIHPIAAHTSAEQAALAYEQELRTHFGRWGRPVFDLALLGLGADGHTASLFPGATALEEKQRWVVAHVRGVNQHARVTLTLPVFNQARRVFFLVTGKEKASALQAALAGGSHWPAQRVNPEKGELVFLVDAAAAAKLERLRVEVTAAREAPV
ncbi:MAG: 6-phosphogluconolactonase [Candidatus Acidiferrales bacterium]